MKIAFLGLGVMGFPMAGHLATAGHEVVVYNRSVEKAARWAETYTGSSAPTPAAAAKGADIVAMCVGADADVLHVASGPDGAISAMAEGAILVDHTTVSAQTAETLNTLCAESGLGFIDAPVSGGEAGAIGGTLTVMCGGEAGPFAQARDALAPYCRDMQLLGPAGSGQRAKMANQICIAGILQGLSEALHLLDAAGLDGKAVIDVISKGAAGSWQMDNRAKTMIDGAYDFGFAVDWMRKDLGIVLSEARALGISLPLTALVDQFYSDVQAKGGGRQDTSSLYRRYTS